VEEEHYATSSNDCWMTDLRLETKYGKLKSTTRVSLITPVDSQKKRIVVKAISWYDV